MNCEGKSCLSCYFEGDADNCDGVLKVDGNRGAGLTMPDGTKIWVPQNLKDQGPESVEGLAAAVLGILSSFV